MISAKMHRRPGAPKYSWLVHDNLLLNITHIPSTALNIMAWSTKKAPDAEAALIDIERLLYPRKGSDAPPPPPPQRTKSFAPNAVTHLFLRARSMSSPLLSSPQDPERRSLKPTAYLDGMRGFAALLVYSLHHQVWVRVGDRTCQ